MSKRWVNLTLSEVIRKVRKGELPTEEDRFRLIEYLEWLEKLMRYAEATRNARQHLPEICL